MMSLRRPPTFIDITPSSQPLMTCPTPMTNWNGSLRSRELSNFLPVGERARVVHGDALALGRRLAVAHFVVDVLQPRRGHHGRRPWSALYYDCASVGSTITSSRSVRRSSASFMGLADRPLRQRCDGRRRRSAPADRRARAASRRLDVGQPPPAPTGSTLMTSTAESCMSSRWRRMRGSMLRGSAPTTPSQLRRTRPRVMSCPTTQLRRVDGHREADALRAEDDRRC